MATKKITQGDPVLTGGLAAITSPTVIPDEASRLDRIGIFADKYSPSNIVGAGLDALTLGAESAFDYLLSPDPYGEAKADQEAKDAAYRADIERRVAEKQAADAAALDALRADSMDIFSDMEAANRARDPRFIPGPDFSGAQSEVRGTEEGPPESRLTEVVDEQPEQPTGEGTDAVEAFMAEQESGQSTQTTEQTSTSMYEKLMQDSVNSLNEMLGKDPSEGKSIDDYKREFSEATGIDVSGDPDNKAALMAFGLALMQNKAGKGFNVGNMLSAVGKAGSEAQPLMIQARKEARAAQLAGGKYALDQKAKDRADRAASIKAEQERIFELQKMQMDADSAMKLERFKTRNEFALKRLENELNPPTVDMYTEKTEKVKLFEGAPDVFTVNSFIANPNVQGNVPLKLTGSAASLGPALRSAEEDLNRVEKDLEFIANVAINDGITVPDQFISATRSLGRAFGINVEGDLDSVAKAKQVLRKIEVLNTAEILGEAGKTISDADRKLVQDIVGQISMLNPTKGADAQKLVSKLNQLHNIIVKKGRRNMDTAYGRLHAAGYDYGPYAQQQQQPTASMNVGDTQEINGVTVKRVK